MKTLIFIDKLSATPTEDEKDTFVEATQVKQALLKMGNEVIIESFTLNLERNLKIIDKVNPDLIFNLVETLDGSDTLHIPPLLFSKKGIKFTGGNAYSLYITGDKIIGKQFLENIGVLTPKYYHLNSEKVDKSLINKKVIIKAKDEESSCGIDDTCVTSFNENSQIINFIKNKPNMFVEEYISGREFSVSVLKIDNKVVVLPIAEMEFLNFPKNKPQILNYKSKWDESSFEYQNTKRKFNKDITNTPLFRKMEEISKRCYENLGVKGYLRVDFRVDKNNIPYVLEINVNPCITNDSGFIAATNQYGITYDKTIEIIIKEAIND